MMQRLGGVRLTGQDSTAAQFTILKEDGFLFIKYAAVDVSEHFELP